MICLYQPMLAGFTAIYCPFSKRELSSLTAANKKQLRMSQYGLFAFRDVQRNVKMAPKPRYCCICSNNSRTVINGRKISLHRFPVDTKLRRVWLQRCKLIRVDFHYSRNDSTRLCSEHFVGQQGPTKLHPLPSVFPNKTFTTSNVQAATSDVPILQDEDADEDMSVDPDTEDTSVCASTDDAFLPGKSSRLELSLSLHDYCGSQKVSSRYVNQCTQTLSDTPVHKSISDGTQTDTASCATMSCNASTQTEALPTESIGIQVDKPMLVYEDIRKSDESIMFYTGIPNSVAFEAMFDEMYNDEQIYTDRTDGGRPHSLRQIDEFFMILMRLRLGLLLDDLAYRFRVSRATCSRLCNKWVDYLYVQLSCLIQWPSRDNVNATMPDSFRKNYPTTRVVIDCTEIWTETPSSLQLQSLLYSDYKSHMTYKSLIGISPAGVVTFCSDLYCGSISDKQITRLCRLVDLCEEGDAIMADKGFVISDLTTPKGIDLIIPPFRSKKKQFNQHEVNVTKTIAHLRIHVERQMERVKNFRILQGVIPITMASQVTKIWRICVYLTNLQPPLVLK